MKPRYALLGGLLLLAGANAMACYTVYDAGGRVVYQGRAAPVDMSLQLHEALAQRFPRGAQMVFDQTNACAPVGVAQVSRPTSSDVAPNTIQFQRGTATRSPSSAAPAPLLTDRATAQRAGLPHTTVAGDVVVVPGGVAQQAMHAGVTVLPATTFAGNDAGGPDTTVLGAGPAPRASARPAVASVRPAARPNVVITELRDPPVTIIEGGGGVTINRR